MLSVGCAFSGRKINKSREKNFYPMYAVVIVAIPFVLEPAINASSSGCAAGVTDRNGDGSTLPSESREAAKFIVPVELTACSVARLDRGLQACVLCTGKGKCPRQESGERSVQNLQCGGTLRVRVHFKFDRDAPPPAPPPTVVEDRVSC